MASRTKACTITRSSLQCPIFGVPCELNTRILPTYEAVMKCYLFIRNKLKPKMCHKEPTASEIFEILGTEIEKIWESASIPIVSHKRVLQLIRNYHEKYLFLIRYPKCKRNKNYEDKVKTFQNESKSQLFDIAICKCGSFSICSCERANKVPVKEQNFLQDQRTSRNMVIGQIDVNETKRLRKREERKIKNVMRRKNLEVESAAVTNVPDEIDSATSSFESDHGHKEAACGRLQPSTYESQSFEREQMRVRLPTLARVCDQYRISDRCAAAISSAVLQDFSIVTTENQSKVIDRSKIRRERYSNRVSQTDSRNAEKHCLTSLFFDGRKDKTLMQEFIEGKYHRRTIVEEHISLIEEPGSVYLGHITPRSGSAISVAESMIAFLERNAFSLHDLCAIGCDGTAVNTGIKTGIIRQFEKKLNHPLHWFVCQLHANELPLRHLFQHLDGKTTSPHAFTGVIGQLLETCERLPVVYFIPIETNLPQMDKKDVDKLSTDQKYLYEITLAVSSGSCSIHLANRNPGKLAHSRWLTTANRLLRLYVSTENPSEHLVTLTKFVMKVYSPMWFYIKRNSSCKYGARNVWKTLHLCSSNMNDEVKQVIYPVIQRNAYFCHPENLLLGMMFDDRHCIRELALRRILKCRKEKTSKLREFTIPRLNFEAQDYIDLINWKEVQITEPPLVSTMSDQELQELIVSKEMLSSEKGKYPSHIQCVERCVKLVTEACTSVCGYDARDGFICSRINSRHAMPCFETKRDYKVVSIVK